MFICIFLLVYHDKYLLQVQMGDFWLLLEKTGIFAWKTTEIFKLLHLL